jgi:hypothetical protein
MTMPLPLALSPLAGLLIEAAHAALALFMKSQAEGREPTLDEVRALGIVNLDRIDAVEQEILKRP